MSMDDSKSSLKGQIKKMAIKINSFNVFYIQCNEKSSYSCQLSPAGSWGTGILNARRWDNEKMWVVMSAPAPVAADALQARSEPTQLESEIGYV